MNGWYSIVFVAAWESGEDSESIFLSGDKGFQAHYSANEPALKEDVKDKDGILFLSTSSGPNARVVSRRTCFKISKESKNREARLMAFKRSLPVRVQATSLNATGKATINGARVFANR